MVNRCRRRARRRELSNRPTTRWHKACGGLKRDQAERLKRLEAENARLKRVVADLALSEAMLKEV